ncbi:MAG: 30S ribosomal protein S4 [Nanoarchaeota archaeon]
MIRKHKKYSKPRKPFEKKRIEEEDELIKRFGLKNKKEIWRGEAAISKIRERAKNLIRSDEEEKQNFFEKLKRLGFIVGTISDVLALTKEDYLNRRLQTIVFKKGLANSIKMGRQMIVHKNVLVNEKIVSSPSYVVPVNLEDNIKLKRNYGRRIETEAKIENG